MIEEALMVLSYLVEYLELIVELVVYGLALIGGVTLWRKFDSTRSFISTVVTAPVWIVVYSPWIVLMINYGVTWTFIKEWKSTLSEHRELGESLIAYSKGSKRLAERYRGWVDAHRPSIF